MQCPQCHTELEDNAIFCGACGKQLAPLQAQGATVVSSSDMEGTVLSKKGPTQNRNVPQPPIEPATRVEPFANPSTLSTPSVHTPPHGNDLGGARPPQVNRRLALIGLIVAIVLLVGAAGAFFVARPNPTPPPAVNGQVTFTDSANPPPGHTNALAIQVTGLAVPPSGSQYQAWLLNDQSEQVVALGVLTAGANSTYTLSFDANANKDVSTTNFFSQNLIGEGNKLEVTLEQGTAGTPSSLPNGRIVLLGTFPPAPFIHIRHLLYSFPTTPQQVGLLVGTREQVQEVNDQAIILQNVIASQDTGTKAEAIQCATQSMLDIIEGSKGAHYQQLSPWCVNHNIAVTGDGFGLLGTNGHGYLLLASQHAAFAANAPGATDTIRSFAQPVENAMKHIEGLLTTIDNDLVALNANPSNTGSEAEIEQLSNEALNGGGTPTTLGAIDAYRQGQQMATLALNPQ